MRRQGGFTLLEMLLVLAILAVLIAASVAGFTHMIAAAERAKAQETVANAATALSALYTAEGAWPKALREGASGEGRLDDKAAWPLAKKKYMALLTNADDEKGTEATELAGTDRFGIVTPWAVSVLRSKGSKASLATKVSPGTTIKDHILYYALDFDGDGIVEAKVGGETKKIRATAAVWCIGKSGGSGGQPWPYSQGVRKDDIYSWTIGQTRGTD